MYNGKCQSCEEYGEVDDIMLCADCSKGLNDNDGGTEGEVWSEVRRASKIKREQNEISSLKILDDKGIGYTVLSIENKHYRVCGFDFWPSTGKFYNQKTGERGRGVFNLIKAI